MNTYYKATISRTGKNKGDKGMDYQCFGDEVKEFNTLEGVKAFLHDEYGNCKRVKSYVDNKDGDTRQSGYIYCFSGRDWSHNEPAYWEQDWVNIYEMQSTPVAY